MTEETGILIDRRAIGTEAGADQLRGLIAQNRYIFEGNDENVVVLAGTRAQQFRTPSTFVQQLLASQIIRMGGVPSTMEASILGRQITSLGLPPLRASMRADCLWFDANAGTWIARERGYYGGLLINGIPHPTMAEDPSYVHLRTLFSGLRADTASKELLECLLCLMIGRAGMPEFPLVMVDADAKNSGKTRTAQALCRVLMAEPCVITDRKRLNQQGGSLAWKPGPNVLLFDNCSTKLFGEMLSTSVHDEHMSVEPKYQGVSKIFFPIMLFTLNQGKVEHDLHDKALWIRLKRDPSAGAAIRFDPDPQGYATDHRLAILNDCRNVLLRAQCPSRDSIDPQTRFIDWERALRGVAAVLGYNIDLTPPDAQVRDQLTVDLLNAIDHYSEAHEGQAPTTRDLVSVIRSFPKDYSDANYAIKGITSARGRARRLNTILKKIQGIPLTNDGECVILEIAEDGKIKTRKEEA